ncbi:MAG TPA: pantoate--beta-alanine ligase [Acidiferrobacterales bacterium]|nr:pantoate--beta-alanine ligase [Acidiferrobacterales bacterium]
MIVAESVTELKSEVARLRAAGRRIAFVPTLGNLHAGHRQLMEQARRHADAVVASIYVNPLQFGPQEDFGAYPRTPEQDRTLLEAAGVEVLFFPDDAAIYPRGRAASTRVEVPGLSDILCGSARPGHFRGVATVVHRLFHLVTPDVALFGKKDYQQLLVIRLMTADFGLPVEIIGIDTVRDADGLAMSSRNGYLTPEERHIAPRLYATLQALAGQIQGVSGNAFSAHEVQTVEQLEIAGFRPDYVSVRRQQDLALPGPGDRQLVILAAAWLGRARLIDNLELDR